MTKSQVAYLKKLAHNIPALFQIGKQGITQNFINQIGEALEARELIKISVHDTSMLDPKEVAYELANQTNSEVVKVIGKKITLYRESNNNKTIILP